MCDGEARSFVFGQGDGDGVWDTPGDEAGECGLHSSSGTGPGSPPPP